jgi:5-methylthioadenosine/S-adenosylhomocysteine deaminase
VQDAGAGHGVLLEGAWVLALDDAGTRGALSVAVEDGRVAGIGRPATMRSRFGRLERIDCRSRILMPGLVNAHLHPDLHVLKGSLEGLDLHDWRDADEYNAGIGILGTDAGASIQRASIRASLAEAALSGTTCVATYGVTNNADAQCQAALGELGLRGALTIRDVHFAPVSDSGTAWQQPVPAMYRLHAEERLDDAELTAAAAAHARGEHIVMHAAETAQRLEIVRRTFNTTTIRLLHRYGLLSPRVLLSHAVFVDAEEIALIGAAGAGVVVSPAAELKLADGIPPVQDMLRAGIPVALGTDAAVCNNSTDMFLEMRALGLSQKLRYGAAAMPPDRILHAATRAGAAVLDGTGAPGRIAEGLAADLILVDVRNPRMQPLVLDRQQSNLEANLVFAATGADVTDVMVAGRWVVRRRRLVNIDARTAWRELRNASRQFRARLQQVT